MISTDNRPLELALGTGLDVDYINVAAAMIRELPGVLRVRVELDAGKLEILHQHPQPGLLSAIHSALLTAGSEIAALRAY